MTEQAQRLKLAIDNAEMSLKTAQEALLELQRLCVCKFPPLTPEQLADPWMSISSPCEICGRRHGWRCKISPDSVCHYRVTNGKVTLLGGEQVSCAESKYSGEHCVYCGLSSERK